MTSNGTSDAVNGTHAKLEFTTFRNVINNELTTTAETRHGINPSTGEPLPEVPVSTQKDLDTAVAYSRKAFKSWSKVPEEERGKALVAFADAIESHQAEFERLLVQEQGKPLSTANVELNMAIEWLRSFPKMSLTEEVLSETEDETIISRYTPLGVAGGIVPWNWPVLLGVGKIGPAIYTGNTIIIKPSPFTPYCDLKLGELGTRIFPPGVLQVLSGGEDLGPMLTEHPGIDKIAFTGSIATGKKVMESCSRTLKRVTLELGGNDPAIICGDVDIDKVVPKVATLAFLNSGQICMLIKRLYVHESIYAQFRDALVKFSQSIKTGDGFEADVLVGPIQNSMQYDKVKDMYSQIDKEGWTCPLRGRIQESSNGYFIEPAIIDNPPETSSIVTEEPFGPILPMLRWRDEDEVIERANDSKMGLGASVWSSDIERAHRLARQLEAGSVWVNSHFVVAPGIPFGGHKWSGLGMEWGLIGLKAYCNPQTLWLRKSL